VARAASTRFAARPALSVVAQVAEALGWPRTRPPRMLAGDRATRVASIALCTSEAALLELDAPHEVAALLATPPVAADGRLGRRAYDPFAGSAGDPASWRRAERVVLDASLLLSGGRGGVDERLSQLVDLHPPDGHRVLPPARPVPRDAVKLVGYVPADVLEPVRDALFSAGAGTIGDYDRCSWSTLGTGTFRGGEGTDPTVGTRGEFEQVQELRLETIVPTHLVDRVCRAFVAAHPYEEPAFDVLPLSIPAGVGFGRVGRLGPGGGSAAWTALSQLDDQLVAHGRADRVPGGATCIVHAGAARDLLDAALAEPGLGLLVVCEASDAELELLDEREVAVLVIDRVRAVDSFAAALAGQLTRRLELPVTVQGALQFPDASFDAGDRKPAAARTPAAAATGPVDYATGTWRLHFDGGSRGNPGPASYGWVLYDPDGEEHDADGVTVGSTTNNVAEWTGLLKGLEHASARGIRSIAIRGDSELVVKQVTGVYRVKNAALKPLAEQVAQLLREFDDVDVKHVYRADNARADELANEALDGLR
jgi:ribonuclease HI